MNNNNLGQVPNYARVKYYQSLLDKAKRDYLKHLISLGYVFEKKGSYEDTEYYAIHPDYYLIEEDRWEVDIDGTISPEFYPVGAFIIINSIAESETDDRWETRHFLYKNRCCIEYLKE